MSTCKPGCRCAWHKDNDQAELALLGLKWCRSCNSAQPISTRSERNSLCDPCLTKARRDTYERNQRVNSLARDFGLTPEDYETLLEHQGGICYVCSSPPLPNKRLAVDHDNKTGLVRGLLCWRCNSGIGKLRDSTDVLERAKMYLSSPPAVSALGRPVYGKKGRLTRSNHPKRD